MRYRKKPVVIDAVQFTNDILGLSNLEMLKKGSICEITYCLADVPPILIVRTLEGNMRAELGDWIIRGVKGELYPCRADIFEATYDRVQD